LFSPISSRDIAENRELTKSPSGSGCGFESHRVHNISRTQELKNSRTQELKNSRTQELKNSRTQELKNSRTQNIEGVEYGA